MTVGQWLIEASRTLSSAHTPSARLDAELLLAYALAKPREYLLAHPEISLQKERTLAQLNERLKRRAKHEPLAYILGEKEFYGRMFRVDKNVLVPRPETEEMIDALRRITGYEIGNKKYGELQIVDIGTGSGCLAVAVKLEWSSAKVIATDISKKALAVAKKNAQALGASIEFFHGSLLEPIQNSKFETQNFTVLANLPYVPTTYPINEDAEHEPPEALFGGTDGLDLYRELFGEIDNLTHQPALVLTEAMPAQHKILAGIAQAHDYKLEQTSGFIQTFRAALK